MNIALINILLLLLDTFYFSYSHCEIPPSKKYSSYFNMQNMSDVD